MILIASNVRFFEDYPVDGARWLRKPQLLKTNSNSVSPNYQLYIINLRGGAHMSFFEKLEEYKDFDFDSYFDGINEDTILNSIKKTKKTTRDFLNMLSPKAVNFLEIMAVEANRLTKQHFGNTVMLYIPIYISNYCTNECVYCGFNKKNHIKRKHLNMEEIESEAVEIAKTGIKHILLLTGEAEGLVDLEYIKDAVRILKKHFAAVSIEIYPLEEKEYTELQELGVHGLTIYQETYNAELYDKVHLSGKKKDYHYRLNCPERGAKAKLNSVTIGTLFGLGSIKEEAFFAGLHAKYLQDKYLETEVAISLPRMNSAEGAIEKYNILDDITYVQIMLAYRLFMPKVGINLSTRETAKFRDKVLNLGITKFSAGSKTSVGAYAATEHSTSQFETSDNRSVEEIVKTLKSYGRDIIFKDWELIV